MLPLLVIVPTISFLGDSANLFSKDYEKTIATEILKGNNVTNVYNYNERILQKFIVGNTKVCPEVLVVGSSRAMMINADYFKNKSFFNSSVSGATIEDLSAILQMYAQKACMPKEIIIGLDPWTLNKSNDLLKWKTLALEYEKFYGVTSVGLVEKKNHFFNRAEIAFSKNKYYLELLSPSYFKSSLFALVVRDKKIVSSKKREHDTFTKIADGSISYDLKFRTASKSEIDKRVMEYLSADIYGIENFHELDSVIKFELDFLIKYLLNKGISVTFFLAPYHPKVFDFINAKEKYKNVFESELYFKDLSMKYGIKLVGSFDPKNVHFDESFFYDGMHLNEFAINRLFN